MSSPTLVHATPRSEPSPLVFGRSSAGEPLASRFDTGSAGLATKAANMMKMRAMGTFATENSFDVLILAGLSPPTQRPSPALTRS